MSRGPTSLLIDDHDQVSALLDRLDPALEAGDPGAAVRGIDHLLARLGAHIRAEQTVVFDALRDARPSDGPPTEAELEELLTQLEENHDMFLREIAEAVDLLKRRAASFEDEPVPAATIDRVGEHLDRVIRMREEHVQLEKEEVYPMLDRFLDDEQSEVVGQRIREELEKAPPRFSLGPSDEG